MIQLNKDLIYNGQKFETVGYLIMQMQKDKKTLKEFEEFLLSFGVEKKELQFFIDKWRDLDF